MGNESFIRWQGRTINQMGFAINVLLILSTGALGFIISILLHLDKCRTPIEFVILLHGALFFAFSILLGCICSINRLSSFRLTAQIARSREKKINLDTIQYRRNKVNIKDQYTWRLFKWQYWLFFLGAIISSIGIAVKLFSKTP